MEHEIWKPVQSGGIDGQNVAIVGYSHYLDGHPDSPELTVDIVKAVVDGRKLHFFSSIRNYFGYQDSAEFWPKVYFFNFIAESVGDRSQRSNLATPFQKDAAQKRILKFFETEQPDKVCIFSREAWKHFPESVEENNGGGSTPLIEGRKNPSWGTYKVREHRILACGFEHPNHRPKVDDIRKQIKMFMSMK